MDERIVIRRTIYGFRTASLLLLVMIFMILSSSGCSEDKQLDLRLLVSPSVEDIASLQVNIGSVRKDVVPGEELSFDVSASIPEGSALRVMVRGYSASGALVGFGASPMFHAVDTFGTLRVWFSTPESLEVLPDVTLPAAASDFGAVLVSGGGPWSDPDSLGGVWGFGGTDSAGHSQPSWYLDPYFMTVHEIPPLPEAKANPKVIQVSPTMALIFGGETSDGTLSGSAFLYSSTCTCPVPYYSVQFSGDGMPPFSGGTLIRLGPYTGIQSGTLELVDAYLLVGARTSEGTDELLRIIAIYRDPYTEVYTLEAAPFPWDRVVEGYISGVALPQTEGTSEVLLAGGGTLQHLRVSVHPADGAFEWNITPVDVTESPDIPSGPGAFRVSDTTAAFAGGTLDGIACSKEVILYNTTTDSTYTVSLDTQVCRADSVARVGDYALVLSSGRVHVFMVDSASGQVSLRSVLDSTRAEGGRLMTLPTGAVALVGGYDADASPISTIEIFNPDPDVVGLRLEVDDE